MCFFFRDGNKYVSGHHVDRTSCPWVPCLIRHHYPPNYWFRKRIAKKLLLISVSTSLHSYIPLRTLQINVTKPKQKKQYMNQIVWEKKSKPTLLSTYSMYAFVIYFFLLLDTVSTLHLKSLKWSSSQRRSQSFLNRTRNSIDKYSETKRVFGMIISSSLIQKWSSKLG